MDLASLRALARQLTPLPASADGYSAAAETEQYRAVATQLKELICTADDFEVVDHDAVTDLAIAGTTLALRARAAPPGAPTAITELPADLVEVFAHLARQPEPVLFGGMKLPLVCGVALCSLVWTRQEVCNGVAGGDVPWSLLFPQTTGSAEAQEAMLSKHIHTAMNMLENEDATHPALRRILPLYIFVCTSNNGAQPKEFHRRLISMRHPSPWERLLNWVAAFPLTFGTSASDAWALEQGVILMTNMMVFSPDSERAKADPEIYAEYAMAFLNKGVTKKIVEYITGVVHEPLSEQHQALAHAYIALMNLAQPKACHTRIVENTDGCIGCTATELHQALMWAVENGGALPKTWGMFSADVRAAMALAMLFGHEESEPGANTVPKHVSEKLVEMLHGALAGLNASSPVNACEALMSLSVSDANTANLVSSGLLDVIAVVLTQGEEILATRDAMMRYDVTNAREAFAAVLLNLSLSTQSVDAVLAHVAVRGGIEHALADAANMTGLAKKRLGDTLLALKLSQETASPHHGSGPASGELAARRHVMISYSWSQQPEVLRIRAALGARGYAVWLDVEQMSGSTVDASECAPKLPLLSPFRVLDACC